MPSVRQRLGRYGETLAARYLESKGFSLCARNWRCPAGEIDLIARDGDCLVFVEVRTRRKQDFGTPEESITAAKQAHLIAVAQTYVQEQGWDGDWRIDVVAIELERDGRVRRLAHLENAVMG